jgi:lipoic acid synthetase
MGDTCARSCGFCKIKTGRGGPLDPDEPRRVAESIAAMGLSHAVLTSVNRDEQPDGGAWVFAESIYWIRQLQPGCTIEVLIPDFRGDWAALRAVMDAPQRFLIATPRRCRAFTARCALEGQVRAQHGTVTAGQAWI